MIPDLVLRIKFKEPGDPAPVAMEALHDAISWLARNHVEPFREFTLHDRSGVAVGVACWERMKSGQAALPTYHIEPMFAGSQSCFHLGGGS